MWRVWQNDYSSPDLVFDIVGDLRLIVIQLRRNPGAGVDVRATRLPREQSHAQILQVCRCLVFYFRRSGQRVVCDAA
jgi:hypothetical protein